MDDEILDPEDFPFTERELALALQLVMPAERAAFDASSHAQTLREVRAARDVFRAIVASGKSEQPYVSYPVYCWPDAECLALLCHLGPEHAARVQVHRARVRAEARLRQERSAMWRTTRTVGVPITREVAAELAQLDRLEERYWQAVCRRIVRLRVRGGAFPSPPIRSHMPLAADNECRGIRAPNR